MIPTYDYDRSHPNRAILENDSISPHYYDDSTTSDGSERSDETSDCDYCDDFESNRS
jgi:hypothetical protein